MRQYNIPTTHPPTSLPNKENCNKQHSLPVEDFRKQKQTLICIALRFVWERGYIVCV